MNSALKGHMAANENIEGLKKEAVKRLTYDPHYPWRGAVPECHVYPEDTEQEIVVRDFTKIKRHRLTCQQENEKDRQKRKAEEAGKEKAYIRKWKSNPNDLGNMLRKKKEEKTASIDDGFSRKLGETFEEASQRKKKALAQHELSKEEKEKGR